MLNQRFIRFLYIKAITLQKKLYLNQWIQQNYLDGYLKI